MDEAKEEDKNPRKVRFVRVSPKILLPIPSKLQRHDDSLSKVIQFHIMRDPTDTQPTIVRREHRSYWLLLSLSI